MTTKLSTIHKKDWCWKFRLSTRLSTN